MTSRDYSHLHSNPARVLLESSLKVRGCGQEQGWEGTSEKSRPPRTVRWQTPFSPLGWKHALTRESAGPVLWMDRHYHPEKTPTSSWNPPAACLHFDHRCPVFGDWTGPSANLAPGWLPRVCPPPPFLSEKRQKHSIVYRPLHHRPHINSEMSIRRYKAMTQRRKLLCHSAGSRHHFIT